MPITKLILAARRRLSRTPKERNTSMFELYKDNAGEWRWRLVAHNNKIIADSGEGYRRRGECVKAVDRVKALVASAAIVEAISKPAGSDA